MVLCLFPSTGRADLSWSCQRGSFLGYSASFTTAPFPGGTTRWWNRFTDHGTDPVRVVNASVVGDLGSFLLQGLPLYLKGGDHRIVNMTLAIPVSAVPGNHTLTVRVDWQYQTLLNSTWFDATPIVDYDHVQVQGYGPSTQEQTPPTAGTSNLGHVPSSVWNRVLALENRILYPAIAAFWILSFVVIAVLAFGRSVSSQTGFQRFCPYCGTRLEVRRVHCPRCGTNLTLWRG